MWGARFWNARHWNARYWTAGSVAAAGTLGGSSSPAWRSRAIPRDERDRIEAILRDLRGKLQTGRAQTKRAKQDEAVEAAKDRVEALPPTPLRIEVGALLGAFLDREMARVELLKAMARIIRELADDEDDEEVAYMIASMLP